MQADQEKENDPAGGKSSTSGSESRSGNGSGSGNSGSSNERESGSASVKISLGSLSRFSSFLGCCLYELAHNQGQDQDKNSSMDMAAPHKDTNTETSRLV